MHLHKGSEYEIEDRQNYLYWYMSEREVFIWATSRYLVILATSNILGTYYVTEE